MRKILLSMMVTLDGFYAGPQGEIDWHNVDEEFNEFAIDQLNSVDALLFGRTTYQLMADYWPTPAAITDDPIVAGKMNELPKIVFSKTLKQAGWQNTRVIHENIEGEITKLKQQTGKDMVIFGSGKLVAALAQAGLIDEYRIFVNPVVLGDGLRLFAGINGRLKLHLIRTQAFRSGNTLLVYQPENK